MTSKEIKEHQFGEHEADRILNFWARELAYQLARAYEFMEEKEATERLMNLPTRTHSDQAWMNRVAALEKANSELQATFDLRWKADMRAIKRWQEAHPGTKIDLPDHADLCVWLLEQLEGPCQCCRDHCQNGCRCDREDGQDRWDVIREKGN